MNRNLRQRSGNILLGLFRLARGDAAGIVEFSNTTAGFSASLAPLVAFPLVTAGLIASSGHYRFAALILLSRICTVLIPPVIIEIGARLTNRASTWVMTATALNWSFWLILPLLLIAEVIANLLVAAGVPEKGSLIVVIALIGVYGFWFQWFTLRAGLRLRWWHALAITLALDAAVALISGVSFHFDQEFLKLIAAHSHKAAHS